MNSNALTAIIVICCVWMAVMVTTFIVSSAVKDATENGKEANLDRGLIIFTVICCVVGIFINVVSD